MPRLSPAGASPKARAPSSRSIAEAFSILRALESSLAAASGPALVAVQAANNETGVLQPIAEIAAIVHAHDGILVCDAVQAAGKLPLDIEASRADALILSGHKLGGPQGTGALVLARRRRCLPSR